MCETAGCLFSVAIELDERKNIAVFKIVFQDQSGRLWQTGSWCFDDKLCVEKLSPKSAVQGLYTTSKANARVLFVSLESSNNYQCDIEKNLVC